MKFKKEFNIEIPEADKHYFTKDAGYYCVVQRTIRFDNPYVIVFAFATLESAFEFYDRQLLDKAKFVSLISSSQYVELFLVTSDMRIYKQITLQNL